MNWRQIPWIRLTVGGVFLALAFLFLREGSPLAVVMLLCGSILWASFLRYHLARPFHALVDLLYFGTRPAEEVPPMNLRLIRVYREERCHDKAIAECRRQLQWHPYFPELWAELVLAYRGAGDREGEASTFQRALNELGMTRKPSRFVEVLLAREKLPCFPAGLRSQFER